MKMIKLLERAKQPNDISKIIDQSIDVYLNCWKNSNNLSKYHLEILILSMARLPPSYHFENPPHAVHFRKTVETYIKYLEKDKSDEDFASDVISKIDSVVNFVKVC